MSCLFCKNFHAQEPKEHREERESRTCAFSCGLKWDAYTAACYVRRHKKQLEGYCLLGPAPERVHSFGICSRYQGAFYPGWKISPRPSECESWWDWAAETMQTFMEGDCETQELKRLRADNATLKTALKTARQRSAARLEKLKKVEAPAKPAKQRAPLRLVAAE